MRAGPRQARGSLFGCAPSWWWVGALVFASSCVAPPPESGCKPPTVSVMSAELDDRAYELLSVRTGWSRAESSQRFLDESFKRLVRRSPEVEFHKFPEGAGRTEYTLNLRLSTIAVEHVNHFWMSASLGAVTSCRDARLVDVEIEIGDDFMGTIEQVVNALGDLRQVTEEYEQRPSAPLRSPQLVVKTEEEETVSAAPNRTVTHVRAELSRCDGKAVGKNKPVYFPKEGARGTLKPTDQFGFDFLDETSLTMGILTNGSGLAVAHYTLTKGIEGGSDPLTLRTCALGILEMAYGFVDVPINDVGVEVKSEDDEVDEGDTVEVVIDVFEEEASGTRRPIPDAPIELNVDGLVDGTLTPSSVDQVNANGRATLKLRGGRKDETVTIRVKYQPEGFEDFVEQSAAVTVLHPPEVKGEVLLRWNASALFSGLPCVNGRRSEGAPIRMPFHLERTENHCRYTLVPDGNPGPVEYRNSCRDLIPFLGEEILYEEIGTHTARFSSSMPGGAPRLDYDATAVQACDTGQPLKVAFDYDTIQEIKRTTVRGEVKTTEGREPGWWNLHCTAWPTQNGLVDQLGVRELELRVDPTAFEALLERCERSRE